MRKQKDAPTLIDTLYRLTFESKVRWRPWQSNGRMRAELQRARRFTLDDRMSAFLADLAHAAFSKRGSCRPAMVEQWRSLARLPHACTWIEYNAHKQRARFRELSAHITIPAIGRPTECQYFPELISGLYDLDENQTPAIEGWLLRQHPQLASAFTALMFGSTAPGGPGALTIPISYCWTSDDAMLPWPTFYQENAGELIKQHTGEVIEPSEITLAIADYHEPRASIHIDHDLIRAPADQEGREKAVMITVAYAGALRRIWSLLATLNDIPMRVTPVVQQKGFLGGHSYRRFLDHSVITLHVPEERDLHKVARQVVAFARRRAHQVRGHWRKDWLHPGTALCAHEWTAARGERGVAHVVCSKCGGRKLFIAEHQRGDASLGFVTHDYSVEHGERNGQ